MVDFEFPTYTVGEGVETSVEVCVILPNGAIATEVVVTFRTDDVTASSEHVATQLSPCRLA